MTNKARIALAAVCLALAAAAAVALLGLNVRRQGSVTAYAVQPVREVTVKALPTGEIDPNNASAEELTALDGIGSSTAAAIVAEREQNGAFFFPEDLTDVKGVGEKTLRKLRERLGLSD